MKKNLGLILGAMVFVGCEQTVTVRKNYGEYSVPDSNKQKVADFVTNSTHSCQRDCRKVMFKAQYIAEKLYGEQIYTFEYCKGINCHTINVPVSKMTETQLALYEQEKYSE